MLTHITLHCAQVIPVFIWQVEIWHELEGLYRLVNDCDHLHLCKKNSQILEIKSKECLLEIQFVDYTVYVCRLFRSTVYSQTPILLYK